MKNFLFDLILCFFKNKIKNVLELEIDSLKFKVFISKNEFWNLKKNTFNIL